MSSRRPAFTLIELLVVVAIIVVLLAMLAPALDKAIESATRAVCGSNLHAWGAAHALYYMDNKRKLMEPIRMWADSSHAGGDGWVVGSQAWVWDQPDKAGKTGQWSGQAYIPYISALSSDVPPTRGPAKVTVAPGNGVPAQNVNTNGPGTGASVNKVFLCPSDARYKNRQERNNSAAQQPPGPTKGAGDLAPDEGGPTIESHYAYFARVGSWRTTPGGVDRAPWADELVDKIPAGGKLLMNDHVTYTSNGWMAQAGGAGGYSHGELPEGEKPRIAGSNHLYGDGGVVWMDGRHFPSAPMSVPTDPSPGARGDIPHYINGSGDYNNGWAPWAFYATGRIPE